jgi:septation ring formation regulator EzrA
MLEMTLKLPESLTRLPEAERELLVRAGLHEATRARIKQVKAEIAEAQREVRRYEARYGMSFTRFDAEILAAADSFQVHEDDNDWFYWQSVLEEKQRDLAALQGLQYP